MFENYEKQGLRAGYTVPYEVTELRNPDGSHPTVHLEHIGRINPTFIQWALANAGGEQKPPNRDEALRDERELMIAHGARRLENAFRSDGSLATDADLPAFIRAIPLMAFERMTAFVGEEKNFCEFPIASDPQALAEK